MAFNLLNPYIFVKMIHEIKLLYRGEGAFLEPLAIVQTCEKDNFISFDNPLF